MNTRERFLRIMRYEPVDRLPVLAFEPFEQGALDRWRGEGLPADQSPVDFLGMDRIDYVVIGLEPDPPFEHKILSEDDEYIVETVPMGATVRRHKSAPDTLYGHVDHPIKTRADWDLYKERLSLDSADRYCPSSDRSRELDESPNPVALLFFPFLFRLGFYTMGMERFLTAFYDEPELMHDMFSHSRELILNALEAVLDVVKIDVAVFNEDLAGKNGPLVSPRTYAEFWHPYQDPIIRMLRDRGVEMICQWSAGQFDVLLPDMMTHGFNCTWPLERIAGMDGLDLRRRYGRELLLGGNIPKEAVLAGPEAIDREIDRLMPLIQEGGFIPTLDDMPPMECPFSYYRYMIERLQAIRLAIRENPMG